MAFGQELKDFVSGFKTGYDMFDSKEDKEWEREKRRMQKEGFERTGQWHDEDRADRQEDRAYRRGRDTLEDDRWNKSFDFRKAESDWDKRRQGMNDEYRERDWTLREREQKLREDDYKLRKAQEQGAIPDGDALVPVNPYEERNAAPDGAIPEPRHRGGEEARAQPASYSDGPASGQEIAYNMVRDLEADYGMPRHVAMGITGALASETGGFTQLQELNPVVPGSRGGGGYAQWTGDRRRAFEEYAGKRNPTGYGDNYSFLRHELDNTPEGRVLDALKRARTAEEAQQIFTSKFLRPGQPNWEGRRGWTRKVEGLFGNAVGASKGGMIAQNYARGGMVSAIPDDEEEVVTTEGNTEETVLPEEGPMPTPKPSYDGAAEGNKEEATDDPYELGRRAVRDGLNKAIADSGAGQDSAIDDPELEKIRQNYIRGYGAAPNQMMRQVLDKVDPDRKMAPGERNMMAMGTVYRYYMDRGEMDKAQEAAKSMVQYYRQTSQQYLALSQAAAEKGDVDNAAKAAVAAYANVPNGRDLDIKKNEDGTLTVSVTDAKSGKQITRQVMSPRDFAAAAMQFNPTTFDDEIMNAAGAPADKYDEASLEDMSRTEGEVRTLSEGMADADGNGMDPKRVSALSNVATGIASIKQNGMGPQEAMEFVQSLTSFDADDPKNDKPGYTTKDVRGNPDLVKVTMNGKSVVMDRGKFSDLTGVRGAMAGERSKGRETDAANTKWWNDQTDLLDKGINAFGAAGQEAIDTMDKGAGAANAGSSIGGMVPQRPRPEAGAIPDNEPAPAPSGDSPEIQELLKVRETILARAKASNKDPRQFGLDDLDAKLKELGYTPE